MKENIIIGIICTILMALIPVFFIVADTPVLGCIYTGVVIVVSVVLTVIRQLNN